MYSILANLNLSDTCIFYFLFTLNCKIYVNFTSLRIIPLVFSVVTQSTLYEKTISNMVEVKSRGAKLFGLTTYGNYNMEDVADFTVYIPKIDNLFAGSLAVIPLQLLSYYVSVGKGFDVDKPRNLAKSVTVE